MPVLRVMHTLQHVGGVPENAVTSTFYFSTADGGPIATAAAEAASKVAAFYDAIQPAGATVMGLHSVHVSPIGAKIKVYRLDHPEPRRPIHETTRTASSQGAGAHPAEVALVLSFSSTPPPGTPQSRRRGRIYIGPLDDATSDSLSTSGDVRPTALARQVLTQAAQELGTLAVGELAAWVTRSTIDGAIGSVSAGFVDDAYDTQRRRGTKATTRTSFVVPP